MSGTYDTNKYSRIYDFKNGNFCVSKYLMNKKVTNTSLFIFGNCINYFS